MEFLILLSKGYKIVLKWKSGLKMKYIT